MTLFEMQKAIKIHRRIFLTSLLSIPVLSLIMASIKNISVTDVFLSISIDIFLGGIIFYIIAYLILKRIIAPKLEFPPGLNERGYKKYKQTIKVYSSYLAGYFMLGIGIIMYLDDYFKL